ncbi:MAG TPA: hypothetical protein VE127_04015 [Solirubrobacteraceae bacterium]|jgi:hypothetical protein|nr:hypothetical protein [Solirubrobacteraceae bacterium]
MAAAIVVSLIATVALATAVPAGAARPAKLGQVRLGRLGVSIGHILGTAAWGIRADVAAIGSPRQENAKLRMRAPRVALLVRRYERSVAPGKCRRSLRALAAAYARGANVTVTTANAFNRAVFDATQRTLRSCA